MKKKPIQKNLVFLILDSVRYDHLLMARTPRMKKLGKVQKRFSYASWTAPSHLVYAMGLLPHQSQRNVFASQIYEKEMSQWKIRLSLPSLSSEKFLPRMGLSDALRSEGYGSHGIVSMPVLNPNTPLALLFDTYKQMPTYNDFSGIVDEVKFFEGKPDFYFVNVGDTHYPYGLVGPMVPHLNGLHGTLKHLGKKQAEANLKNQKRFFTKKNLRMMADAQIACIENIDSNLEELFNKCPPNTHLIITSDHGELFGEDGFFGHGPVMHPKVFEVPLIEGIVP